VTIDAGRVNGACHIRVIDRGPGVALVDRPRVVQPFQRLDDTSPEGAGLGLAIAQGFVNAMHGTFTLDDTPGGGLTVTVSLPLAAESAR
jgi:two-component system sensor histidine kinase KdpD